MWWALCEISCFGGVTGERYLNRIEEAHSLDLIALEHPEWASLIHKVRGRRTVYVVADWVQDIRKGFRVPEESVL